jgi:hypothetical protein
MGNGKSAELDTTADDGQLEEIVPWLYQCSDVGCPSTSEFDLG